MNIETINNLIKQNNTHVIAIIIETPRIELENSCHDLLYTAAKYNFAVVLTKLVEKGLKSDHAMTISISTFKNKFVKLLANFGVGVNPSTLRLAYEVKNYEAYLIISTKLVIKNDIESGIKGVPF